MPDTFLQIGCRGVGDAGIRRIHRATAEGIVHAFLLEKDKVMRQVLETIGDCEQRMIDKKKKLNNLNEVRKQMREREALQAQLRGNS